MTVDHEKICKAEITVAGIAVKTSNARGAAEVDIPKLWDNFFREGIMEKIPFRKNDAVIALYTDYEGDFTNPYTVIIGCEVFSAEDLPQGIVCKTVPSGSYAVFKPEGTFPERVLNAWEAIWQSTLQRNYCGDFEIYPAGFWASPHDTEMEIHIGLHS